MRSTVASTAAPRAARTRAVTVDEAVAAGLRLPRPSGRPRLSSRLPWLYPWAVRWHRARHRWEWWTSGWTWCTTRAADDLPVRVRTHSSPLLRELPEPEMRLQHGKVTNLRLAAARIDGLLIAPGETFSFNRVVGNCTRRKGYVEGMRLSDGAAQPGIGGGICQLANLLHWMFLHAELTIVERSEHSFDPFPDNGRVLPWGVGCSIAYNYVDLVVRNDTESTFQLRTWVADGRLRGLLLADRGQTVSYHVEARGERFFRLDGSVYRVNQIWHEIIDRRTGDRIGDELVKRNCALVKYHPPEELITDVVG